MSVFGDVDIYESENILDENIVNDGDLNQVSDTEEQVEKDGEGDDGKCLQ